MRLKRQTVKLTDIQMDKLSKCLSNRQTFKPTNFRADNLSNRPILAKVPYRCLLWGGPILRGRGGEWPARGGHGVDREVKK